MASTTYSKSVLAGLQKKGLTLVGASRVSKASESRIRAILSGKASFTDAQLNAIETATGLTAGQIAMSVVKADKALAEVMNAGAKLNQSLQKPARRSKRAVA